MLPTRISRLQWWLLIALFTITFVTYPHVHEAAWWWSVLFIIAFYFAVLAILRLDIETRRQAVARKQRDEADAAFQAWCAEQRQRWLEK